jgi:two-component system NtrC family sensor kinase
LIIKPFSGVDFVQNVDRALEERRRRQETLRLQALQPLFEVSETLFALRDQSLLADTLVKVTHRILANDFTALLVHDSFKLPDNAPKKKDKPWQIVGSLGEINLQSAQPGEALANLLPMSDLKEPVLIGMERNNHSAWQQILSVTGQGSLMFVSIPIQYQKLAILSIRSTHRDRYTQADLETLIILARQSSVAFENARLYAKLTDSLNQAELSQNALLQAERLAAAGRLTASIAHEINNPLQALQNCLDLVSRKDLEREQRQKYLDLAISELNRLMSTVDRMLAFYRPIARDRELVNLNEVIQRAVDLLQPQFEESAVTIHNQIIHEPLFIMAVASQIQQVLFNLLINAMEAMPEGGDIWISSRSITGAESKSVEVIIEDSGLGIHGEQLEHLFEPLVSNKPHGTGLGLAVSYGIVEAHGGTLKLLSGSHTGACFQIILPEE